MEPCAEPGCDRLALSFRDRCFVHLPDPQVYGAELRAWLDTHRELRGLNLSGVPLADLELSDRLIWHCCLTGSRLSNVRITRSRIQLLFLDFADLDGLHLGECNVQCAVLAGSRMAGCSFSDSELLRCNLIGIQGTDLRFSGCDLYSSRFISAHLERSIFQDCNLKRVRFEKARLESTEFPSSNEEDAFFEGED